MIERVEIRGGPGEFEAAVIAIVLDHMAYEELTVRSRLRPRGPELPAWVRALPQQTQFETPEWISPEGR